MIKEKDGDLVITKKGEDLPEEVIDKKEEGKKEETTESLVITSASSEIVKIKEEEYIPQDDDGEFPNEEGGAHVKEQITITASSSYNEEEKKIDGITAIQNAIKDAGLEDELSKNEEDVIDKFISKTKVVKPVDKNEAERVVIKKSESGSNGLASDGVQIEAVGLLEKFKEYVTSNKFDKKCETAAKKHGVKKDIVKNKVIAGFLGTIANVLGLSITLIGDVIMSAVNFIGFIINKILEFAVDNLKKLITLLTLNCGETI